MTDDKKQNPELLKLMEDIKTADLVEPTYDTKKKTKARWLKIAGIVVGAIGAFSVVFYAGISASDYFRRTESGQPRITSTIEGIIENQDSAEDYKPTYTIETILDEPTYTTIPQNTLSLTSTQKASSTPYPTKTKIPPTKTKIHPTKTSVPPTHTPIPPPTNTPIPPPTNTPYIPPTITPVPPPTSPPWSCSGTLGAKLVSHGNVRWLSNSAQNLGTTWNDASDLNITIFGPYSVMAYDDFNYTGHSHGPLTEANNEPGRNFGSNVSSIKFSSIGTCP